ncbi:unnamed protein product [Coregonus sp. 'balchen']|nr:unnamed protein product [Coregonus sp. 'balchen']
MLKILLVKLHLNEDTKDSSHTENTCLQILGILLGMIGWFGDINMCALSMEKVTAFIGNNIVTAQIMDMWPWWSSGRTYSHPAVYHWGKMHQLHRGQDVHSRQTIGRIFIGWGYAGLMLLGRGIFCSQCSPSQDRGHSSKYNMARSVKSYSARAAYTQPLVMGRIGKEVSGQVLSFLGFVGVAVTTGIPMWRVTTYIGANIVTGQIVWDGLWMNCVMQSTGQMQCKINDSVMRLATDLQAARAMVIISIIFSFVGLIVTFIGGQCTSCLKSDSSKSKVTILGGILLLISGLLVLIPVCWSAAFTISDFNNPLTIETQRRELGASIYIGWGSTALLLIGGITLCTSCPPQKMYGYPGYPQGAPMYPYPGQPMVQAGPYGRVYTPTSRPYSGTGSYMLGFALAIIGFLGTIIVCALPMWKVTAFIGANIVTAQVIWEGLWMNCVTQSTGQMQCKIYDSLLALPQDLQAARALSVIAIIASCFGILLGIAGGKCTNFVEDEASKAKVAIASGIIFIVAGVLILVPVCWSANTIIRDFYNPLLVEAQRRELGASLYIGWGTAGLLILGGGLLCSSCPPKEERDDYPVKYSQARSTATSRAYV